MPFSYTVSPMDYGAVSTILRFDACDTRHCVGVTIVIDGDDEPDEIFGITLERTPGLNDRITLDPVDGDITIADNDIDGMILKHLKSLQQHLNSCVYFHYSANRFPYFVCVSLVIYSSWYSLQCRWKK